MVTLRKELVEKRVLENASSLANASTLSDLSASKLASDLSNQRVYLVNVNNQESVVKAQWAGEAVMKVMNLHPYEIDKQVTIDDDEWYVVDTVKGTAYAKPLANVEGLIEKHQVKLPYRVFARAYRDELCVYADYYRTRAKTQKGLARTMEQIEDNFKHILDVMGYDWTRLSFNIEYK